MNGKTVLALRKRLGLNQQDFWTPLGSTQSGGSRYEHGRDIPKPLQQLIAARYMGKPVPTYKRAR